MNFFVNFLDPKTYVLLITLAAALWALPAKVPRLAKVRTYMAFTALLLMIFFSANITLLMAKHNKVPGYDIHMDVESTSNATKR